METQTTPAKAAEHMIQLVLNTWTGRNAAVSTFFNKAENDRLYSDEVAPGRNRAIYLLGHLAATNDALFPLLGFGDKLFPELESFSSKPDRSFEIGQSIAELKQQWETINSTLTSHFNALSTEEWLDRHTAVSQEDFEKEPHRNRLNVLLGRTNHQSYHLGQLNFLTFN